MKRLILFGVALCITMVLGGVAGADSEWVEIDSDKGIRSYEKKQATQDMCENKSVGFVNAPLAVVGAVIRDIPAYPEWSAMCATTEVLEYKDRNNAVFYSVMDPPFSLKKQDMVINRTMQFDFKRGTAQIDLSTTDTPRIPRRGGCVRLSDFTAQYQLVFFGKNVTRVAYAQKIHGSDKLKDCPRKNIQGLRKKVTEQRYIDRGLSSVENILVERMVDDVQGARTIIENRVGDVLVDPALLSLLFSEKRLAEYVYAEQTSFKSLMAAIKGLFRLMLTNPKAGQYLQAKSLTDVLSVKPMMENPWLASVVFKDKQWLTLFLDNANGLFGKLLQSEEGLRELLNDVDLAGTIAANQPLQKKILSSARFKEALLNNVDAIESRKQARDVINELAAEALAM